MVRDKYHDHVKEALESDGWTITHDPYKVQMGTRRGYIDLGAERLLIGAERGKEKIAVEVKTFVGLSDLNEFEQATGQFMLYVYALQRGEPDRRVYLGVPSLFFNRFFTDSFFEDFIRDFQIRLLVFDEDTKRVLTWIK